MNTLQSTYIKEFFSYMRPHGSEAEQAWITTFILPKLPATTPHFIDGAGNIHLDMRTAGKRKGKARTLFVAHTDTVHREDGRQTCTIDKKNFLRVGNPKKTNCLGADDGAGVIVLLNLIAAKVPAYYIFTRCEERGGLGAKHLVDSYALLLAEFDRAIAFDRKGTSSVITHQGWGRCCSDTFADALSEGLSGLTTMYAPDDTGVYTDTAEFVDIIPECTNISVGYTDEHTTREALDLGHLQALINRVLSIDWEALPVDRDPTVKEKESPWAYDWFKRSDYPIAHDPSHNSIYSYTPSVYDIYDEDNMDGVHYALVMAQRGDTEELLWMMADVVWYDSVEDMYEELRKRVLPMAWIDDALCQVEGMCDPEDAVDVLADLAYKMLNNGGYYE